MKLTEAFLNLVEPATHVVAGVLLAISFLSFSIILERLWFFWKRSIDGPALTRQIFQLLRSREVSAALSVVHRRAAAECVVLTAGLSEWLRTGRAEPVMHSARSSEAGHLEQKLTLLAILSRLALFLGGLGLLLEVIAALQIVAAWPETTHLLSGQAGEKIIEGLILAALGVLVALPPYAAAALFQQRVRAILQRIDCLIHMVASESAAAGDEAAREQPAAASDANRAAA